VSYPVDVLMNSTELTYLPPSHLFPFALLWLRKRKQFTRKCSIEGYRWSVPCDRTQTREWESWRVGSSSCVVVGRSGDCGVTRYACRFSQSSTPVPRRRLEPYPRLLAPSTGFKFGTNSIFCQDRLCGLVVRVTGYRSRGPGLDSPALPGFLNSSVSGTGSTQPHEDNWGAIWWKK
jgi:hypothetical protein